MKTSEFEIKSCTKIGQRIEQFYRDYVLDAYNKAVDLLIELIAQNPSHALEWLVENMLVKHAADQVWRRTVVSVRDAVTEHQAKDAVMNHVREVAKHVLRFPPRHNCTGEVSNLSSLAENQARCEFVQTASGIADDFTFAS